MATADLVPTGQQVGVWSNPGDGSGWSNLDDGKKAGAPSGDSVNSADGAVKPYLQFTTWSAGNATNIKLYVHSTNFGAGDVRFNLSLDDGVSYEGVKTITPAGGGSWQDCNWDITESNLDDVLIEVDQDQFIQLNDLTLEVTYTAAAPEMRVTGATIEIVDGDAIPSPLDATDWGDRPIGVPFSHSFTIHNTGDANLNLTDPSPYVVIGGAQAADFALVPGGPTTPIAPAGSVAFSITFTPGAAGLRSATLSIANDDADENPYNWSIQGTGVASSAPEMNVKGNSTSIVDGDGTPSVGDATDWGNVRVGIPFAHTFQIFNTGTANLNLTDPSPYVVFGGAHAADFAVGTAPTTPIAAAGDTNFPVEFTPGAAGLRSATLSIANDDADENPYNFSIQGTGVASSAKTGRSAVIGGGVIELAVF